MPGIVFSFSAVGEKSVGDLFNGDWSPKEETGKKFGAIEECRVVFRQIFIPRGIPV